MKTVRAGGRGPLGHEPQRHFGLCENSTALSIHCHVAYGSFAFPGLSLNDNESRIIIVTSITIHVMNQQSRL